MATGGSMIFRKSLQSVIAEIWSLRRYCDKTAGILSFETINQECGRTLSEIRLVLRYS